MCGGNPVGDIFSGVQNMSNALQVDAIGKGNAKTVKSVARQEAERIKRQGKAGSSSARAAAAENGLEVDQGAAAMIQDEHIGNAAYNASLGISDSENQAQQIRQQAKLQRNNYGMNAASSFVSAGMKIAGWK